MLTRTSFVNNITIDSLSSSSITQVGDSTNLILLTRALAVRREYPLFYGREGNFDDYAVFKEDIPVLPITPIAITTYNEVPAIRVNYIDIIGVGFSSVVHIGSTCNVYAESRIKHIRQLLGNNSSENPLLKKEEDKDTTPVINSSLANTGEGEAE
ncbi:spore germination protein GerPE [Metabacillus iocasae]|uniref:Spore germination protein PE n=1 Tax=Priestia iocasae TaxID=2291674 RepID=A0ABS2QUG8_9BACI|nr:spore germination protein GerPE [Metabacillus iocasae]MBM7702637.1 spore germination protein PE [Metabacillus iocasae]